MVSAGISRQNSLDGTEDISVAGNTTSANQEVLPGTDAGSKEQSGSPRQKHPNRHKGEVVHNL